MAILATMSLMAVPRYLGYTNQAKDKKIVHDIKVLESTLDMYLFNHESFSQIGGFDEVSSSSFAAISPKFVYSGDGKDSKIEGTQFYLIPDTTIKKESGITADGTFITNEKGVVYYLKTTLSIPKKQLIDAFNPEIMVEIDPDKIGHFEIISYNFPTGYYKKGEVLEGSITVKALQSGRYYGYFRYRYEKSDSVLLKSTEGKTSHYDYKDVVAGESYTFKYSFIIGETNPSGYAGLSGSRIRKVKTGEMTSDESIIDISTNLPGNQFDYQSVYITDNDWLYYDKSRLVPQDRNVKTVNGNIVVADTKYRRAYSAANPILGQTIIDGQNAGTAQIQIKPNDTITGSVLIDEKSPYGTYEARMNIPSSKALLNSFFLYYNDPVTSNEYEIDIEIYYRYGKWMFSTAIYNEAHPEFDRLNQGMNNPGQVHSKKVELPFDPTLDYHTYRIDYYPNHIAFYMDDKELVRWNESFEFFYMQPRVTSYYADWLDSEPISSVSDTMDVSWIRTKLVD